jgi:hypothetical protein
MAAEERIDVGQDDRRGRGDLAHTMQERWQAINEIAALIDAGKFLRASNLAKHVLPLPKDLTQGDLQELAEDFDARVKTFRRVLEVRDPMQSLQAWNTVFQVRLPPASRGPSLAMPGCGAIPLAWGDERS